MVSQGWGHSSQTTQVIFWMLEALPRHRVDQVKDPGYELGKTGMNASCFLRHTACSEVGERGPFHPLQPASEDICLPGWDPSAWATGGLRWAWAWSPGSAGVWQGTCLGKAELSHPEIRRQSQEEQPGCRDYLSQHLWKPLHLEGRPPKAPPSSGLTGEGDSGAITNLRPEKQNRGRQSILVHSHSHTAIRARSKIRTGRSLTPRYTAKPQTHADSWQGPFHIPPLSDPP